MTLELYTEDEIYPYLRLGEVYTFHMSAAISRLYESDFEVTGEFLGSQAVGNMTLLIVKGSESGETIALNARHLGLIDKPNDEDTNEDVDGIEVGDDGTRTITIDA